MDWTPTISFLNATTKTKRCVVCLKASLEIKYTDNKVDWTVKVKRQKTVPGLWPRLLFVDLLSVFQNLALREGIKILPCVHIYSRSRLSCLAKNGSVQVETHILMWTRLGGGLTTVSCQVFKPSRYSAVFWWSAYKFFQSLSLSPSFFGPSPPSDLPCISSALCNLTQATRAQSHFPLAASVSQYNPDFCVSKHSLVSCFLILTDNSVLFFCLQILTYLHLSKT